MFTSPRIRTGYSFRTATGELKSVFDRLESCEAEYFPITDRASTFGFYRWKAMCEKAGKKPVFGVELAVSPDPTAKKPTVDYWTFIPTGQISAINKLVELATVQFRYEPILSVRQALSAEGCIKITGDAILPDAQSGPLTGVFFGLSPSSPVGLVRAAGEALLPFAAVSNNSYTLPTDRPFFEVVLGRNAFVTTYDQHIQTEQQWRDSVSHHGLSDEAIQEAINNSQTILQGQKATLQKSELPTPPRPASLRELCEQAAPSLGVDLSDKEYADRLTKELDLIELKGYEDYFYIVLDICQWARERMAVGPARGSSCGSLVCFLLRITTVDPIPHGLIFERFIDINRNDMPDIDIDFSDQHRHLVFSYIKEKYGEEHSARIGSVAMYHPKSILNEVSAALRIPRWKTDKVSDTLIERSGGDSRALDTLLDTLHEMPSGKALLADHPEAEIGARMEGHPRHYSQHAAGVVISSRPITDFVAVDHRTGSIMCDKKDAEDGYNLLKIDALGLTQLSILEDTLSMAGLPRDHLENLPLEDEAAFNVLNQQKWSGIFQFDGIALQSLCKQTTVDCFNDIVAITALARPGPLTSGGASDWVYRKNGWDPRTKSVAEVTYPHPLFEPYMNDTYGVVMFQEQVMEIGRNVGDLSWEDVTLLRKAMSKSLGKEYFDQFGDKFKSAAMAKGIPGEVLEKVWDDLCAYGAWAFNKSHSVAYGLISYWCCWLKAHHPFEFAAASLTHKQDPEKQIALLREMAIEGYDYVPVDPELSTDKWTSGTRDGKKVLVGPVQNVKGIGPKLISGILGARARGEPLPERAQKLLANPETKIDSLFPITDRVKELMPDPIERNIHTPITKTIDIDESHTEEKTFLVVGVAHTINPRDENEPIMVARRGYKITRGPVQSLNLQIRDDSGIIYCKVDRWKFKNWGESIIDRGRPGKSIYAVRGSAMAGRRFLMVDAVKYIGDMDAKYSAKKDREKEDKEADNESPEPKDSQKQLGG